MEWLFSRFYRIANTLPMMRIVLAIMLVSVIGSNLRAHAQMGAVAPGPALEITAPAQVALGAPIELTLTVKGMNDIAGYEGNLLFDTSVAEFHQLLQRQNDLKQLGRDIVPLGAVEMPTGVAIGLSSCPVRDCVAGRGPRQGQGGRGTVKLATVALVAAKPGVLEIKLDGAKFVDAAGAPISVVLPAPISVQVGPNGDGPRYAAPASTWQLPVAPAPNAGSFDLTGDGLVTHADAMEVALAWTVAREKGSPCGSLEDPSRDVTQDGCVDVTDLQLVVANYSLPITSSSTGLVAVLDWLSSPAYAAPQAAPAAQIGTFTVTSTGDSVDANIGNGICATSTGVCTLRAAIAEANRRAGPDTIAFNLSGSGVQTIQLGSRLPVINDTTGPTTIDGYTQPGAAPNTNALASNATILVQLVGTAENNFGALFFTSPGNRVRGLAFYKFTQAIRFYGSGATDNAVVGCFVGTNAATTYYATATYGGSSGVHVQQGASRNYVGGTSPGDRNVLSGNAHHGFAAYDETTDANVVINNLVGLSAAGGRRVPNRNHGIDINFTSRFNVIGGTNSGERNVVSGNGYEGIEFSHGVSDNKAIGNFIGTDVTGNQATSYSYNVHYGVHVEDVAKRNIIANNVIGNNRGGGINITAPYTTDNQVHTNRIGISRNGTAIPNSNFGIQVDNRAVRTKIGPNNIITNNPVGIRLTSTTGTGHTITRNTIRRNTALGIDLDPLDRVNPNDSGDTDSGPNDLLNFPVLTSATTQEVKGTACASCTVEIFVADNDESGHGEGRTFVGSAKASTTGAFTVVISGAAAGDSVTATATDGAGNTSEFARNVLVR